MQFKLQKKVTTTVFTALHFCRAVLAMSEMSVCPSVSQTREL